jgi:hypothetical protein
MGDHAVVSRLSAGKQLSVGANQTRDNMFGKASILEQYLGRRSFGDASYERNFTAERNDDRGGGISLGQHRG